MPTWAPIIASPGLAMCTYVTPRVVRPRQPVVWSWKCPAGWDVVDVVTVEVVEVTVVVVRGMHNSFCRYVLTRQFELLLHGLLANKLSDPRPAPAL